MQLFSWKHLSKNLITIKKLIPFKVLITLFFISVFCIALATNATNDIKNTSLPKYEVLINNINPLNISNISSSNLIYSDITMNSSLAYTVSENTLEKTEQIFMPYTEGFIKLETYEQLMSPIRKVTHNFPTTFHDYDIFDNYAIVSFSGGLESVYIINLATNVATPVFFKEEDNLGKMYVSYASQIGSSTVVLAYEANAYNAFVYIIDLETATVTKSTRIQTSTYARFQKHFSLLSNGLCYFMNKSSVDIYNPFTDEHSTTPIPFSPNRILSDGTTMYAIEEAYGLLNLFNLMDSSSVSLTLPSNTYEIIDLFIDGNNLFLALFDPSGTRFINYYCIYDLSSAKWLYCMGLEHFPSYALTTIQPTYNN
ncbi:MAG: hypothetical protein ACRCSG_04635 [Cellulosilyticaceae bacterium]